MMKINCESYLQNSQKSALNESLIIANANSKKRLVGNYEQ